MASTKKGYKNVEIPAVANIVDLVTPKDSVRISVGYSSLSNISSMGNIPEDLIS